MFDRYLLEEGTLRNVERDGEIVGWSVGARIGYYRGLGLSMIDVALSLDGEAAPRERIHVQVHGNDHRLTDLQDVLDDRWGFTETATLFVEQPGGLAPGSHEVALEQSLRISYLAIPSVNRVKKQLTLG
jgi:hypothetical protein